MFVAPGRLCLPTASARVGRVLLIVVPYQFEPNIRASPISI